MTARFIHLSLSFIMNLMLNNSQSQRDWSWPTPLSRIWLWLASAWEQSQAPRLIPSILEMSCVVWNHFILHCEFCFEVKELLSKCCSDKLLCSGGSFCCYPGISVKRCVRLWRKTMRAFALVNRVVSGPGIQGRLYVTIFGEKNCYSVLWWFKGCILLARNGLQNLT